MPKPKIIKEFKVKSLDNLIKKTKPVKRTNLSPSQPCNILVAGKTSSGKTNAVFNMILGNFIFMDKLILCTKDLSEGYYKTVIDAFPQETICDLDNEDKSECDDSCLFITQNIENLPPLNKINEGLEDKEMKHVVVIIDDMLNENNSKLKIIKDYFIRGRKRRLTIFYLTQDFFKTPKLVRSQSSVFMLWRPNNKRDMMEIAKTLASDMDNAKFIKMFQIATELPHDFMYIDINETGDLKYRHNFDDY